MQINNGAKNQTEAIKIHLINKGSITSLEAFKRYGITRLAARICTLRKYGMSIETKSVKHINAFGNSGTYAKYELITNQGIL